MMFVRKGKKLLCRILPLLDKVLRGEGEGERGRVGREGERGQGGGEGG